jgi:hypothetical protein
LAERQRNLRSNGPGRAAAAKVQTVVLPCRVNVAAEIHPFSQAIAAFITKSKISGSANVARLEFFLQRQFFDSFVDLDGGKDWREVHWGGSKLV